jgi:hypothetical protein
MANVQEIEKAISSLPPKELAKFRAWFEEFDAAVWDRQFEEDARSGRLDEMANKALADFKDGKFKEL